jgi:hypothetical protein
VTSTVFVLMVWGYASAWIPTMEFSTQQKCDAAVATYIKQGSDHMPWGAPDLKAWCMKVEK